MSDLKTKCARRFEELNVQFGQLMFRSNGPGYGGAYVQSEHWLKWATNAANLLRAACGDSSEHVKNFAALMKECHGGESEVRSLLGVFQAAREDFEGGYLFDVEKQVSGEVFGDFVALAKRSLADGHKDVAAVLASAALEDCLKRYAAMNIQGVDLTEKTMHEVVNALKAAGLVVGAQKSLLDAMPKVRNAALHGNWDKLTEADVGSLIGFVEQFLLTKFS